MPGWLLKSVPGSQRARMRGGEMRLTSPQDWIAWAGIVLPLAALAWSAVFYTMARRREVQHREFERFFQVTDHLGQQGGSIASKMAAAYELRKYRSMRR